MISLANFSCGNDFCSLSFLLSKFLEAKLYTRTVESLESEELFTHIEWFLHSVLLSEHFNPKLKSGSDVLPSHFSSEL